MSVAASTQAIEDSPGSGSLGLEDGFIRLKEPPYGTAVERVCL